MKFFQLFSGVWLLGAVVTTIASQQNYSATQTTAYVKKNITPVQDKAEKTLLQIIELIRRQQTDNALGQTTKLLQQYPTFQLARVLQHDLLVSLATPLQQPFTAITDPQKRADLLSEITVRLDGAHYTQTHEKNRFPALVKYLDKKISYFVIIDLARSRLYLFQNSPDALPRLLTDHYVTAGKKGLKKQTKGDEKTPIGVYRVTTFLEDGKLPELYGWGAFPINYPNSWDKLHHRTGSGIWLHGVPRDTYSRPPLDSKGCVVVSNDFLVNIAPYLRRGTPVIITQNMDWLDQKDFTTQSQAFYTLIQDWKNAWESKNIKRYLSFYSRRFDNHNKNYQGWKTHKSRVFKYTPKIQVTLSQIKIFAYPGEKNLLSVSFYQKYNGGHFKSHTWKQQYWKKEADGQWRIIYEGKRL